MTKHHIIAGIDISQDHSDVAIAGLRTKRFNHQPDGLKALADYLYQHAVNRAVMEATGGYERPVYDYLTQICGIQCDIVNPSRVRAFAKAAGRISKTDALDAAIIRQYAETMLSDNANKEFTEQNRELQALTMRREQVVAMRKSEKQRRSHPGLNEAMRQHIDAMIAYFNSIIKELEDKIATYIQQHEILKARMDSLLSMPSIGEQTAYMLLAYMPELGRLDGSAIASLAGLAPHAKESGKITDNRHIRGGRQIIRRAMYMAALSAKRYHPILKEFAAKLKAKGKAPKQIIIAVARKMIVTLNAMCKSNAIFNPNHT